MRRDQRVTKLIEGMETLALKYDAAVAGRMIDFIELLGRWNRVYNLTAIDDLDEMIVIHLLDSLAAAPWLTGEHIVDIGSGAGLPGIPLALLFADRSFTLLDSNAKKTRFLQQVKVDLAVTNIEVVHARVEQFTVQSRFDTVITRAFSSLSDILEKSRHLLGVDGTIVALKGDVSDQELNQCRNVVSRRIPLTVPGLQAERQLILLRPFRLSESSEAA